VTAATHLFSELDVQTEHTLQTTSFQCFLACIQYRCVLELYACHGCITQPSRKLMKTQAV